MTGADISKACTTLDMSWVEFCNGYIQAVVDNLREGDKVCLPSGATRTDLVTVAEKEITGSKRLRAMNAHDAVFSVLKLYYPCR